MQLGAWVWVESEDEVALPGEVVEGDRVQLESGELVELPEKDCEVLDTQCLDSKIDNLIKLNELSEKALLHVLRLRYAEDSIYTYVSDILLSVNPFKCLNIYSPEVVDRYIKHSTKEPHAYAVSAAAYEAMIKDGKSQAILISGESGAGKTEATKLILQFLVAVSAQKASRLEAMILRSNPITESFGNAKTLRNENSSRFGKWTRLHFSQGTGSIIGGEILHYLLEKSRVAVQTAGERNYHCFYQLNKCFEPAVGCHSYISTSTETHTINDLADYDDLLSSLTALKIDTASQQDLFQATTAVLLLGDLDFAEANDASYLTNRTLLIDSCAPFLGCDPEALEESLIARTIGARSVVRTPLSANRARDARDAFAKAVFQSIFDFLISTINKALSASFKAAAEADSSASFTQNTVDMTIGVLDLFGFEVFEHNSLEQLLINFTNEKLQFFFNETIFSNEAKEYQHEGIPLDLIDFKNNEPTLQLLQARRTGIFTMIDEEVAVPRGTDAKLASKIIKAHQDNPCLAKPTVKHGVHSFGICHFAGTVYYDCLGFVEKNRDRLLDGLAAVGISAKKTLVTTLFLNNSQDKKQKKTVVAKFQHQLESLMTTLQACAPHFVRCIKPNAEKLPNVFTATSVLMQMRYSGVLEVCKIRRAGFPYRLSFTDFIRKYQCCSQSHESTTSAAELCAQIIDPNEFAVGKTKIFLRAAARDALDISREKALRRKVALFQASVRGGQARSRYHEYIDIIHKVRLAISKNDAPTLDRFIESQEYTVLPHGGTSILVTPLVTEAKRLIATFAHLKASLTALHDASQARDLGKVTAALASVKNEMIAMNGSVQQNSSLIKDTENLLQVLRTEATVKRALQAALSSSRQEDLKAALEETEKLIEAGGKIPVALTTAAHDALTLMRKRDEATAALESAEMSRDLDALKAATLIATEVGVDCSTAKMLIEELRLEHSAISELEAAIEAATSSREVHTLDALLRKHRSLSDSDLYVYAERLSLDIHEEQAKTADLKAALEAALVTPNTATRTVLKAKLENYTDAKETPLLKEARDLENSFFLEETACIALQDKCNAIEEILKKNTSGDISMEDTELSAMLADELEPALTDVLKQRISADTYEEELISSATSLIATCKSVLQSREKERARIKAQEEELQKERRRFERLMAADKALLDMVDQFNTKKQSISDYRTQREKVQAEVLSAQHMGLNTKGDGMTAAVRALASMDIKLAAVDDLEQLYKSSDSKHEDEVEVLQSELDRLVIELSDVEDDTIKSEVDALRSTIDKLRSQLSCREELTKAMIDRDLDALQTAKVKAAELGISSIDYIAEVANELESTRDAEQKLVAAVHTLRTDLEAAISTGEVRAIHDKLVGVISTAQSSGLVEDGTALKDAKEVQEVCLSKKRSLVALGRLTKVAQRSRDPSELEKFLSANENLGDAVLSTHPAIELLTTLQVEQAAIQRLRAADLALTSDDSATHWIELEAAVQAASKLEYLSASVEFSSLKVKVEAHTALESQEEALRTALETGNSDEIKRAVSLVHDVDHVQIAALLQIANTKLREAKESEDEKARLEARNESDRIRHEAELKALEGLNSAIAKGDRSVLTTALSTAYDLGTLYDADEVFTARKALREMDHKERLLQAVDEARAHCVAFNVSMKNVDDEIFAFKSATSTLLTAIHAVPHQSAEEDSITAANEILKVSQSRIAAIEHLGHILNFECLEPRTLEVMPLPETVPAQLDSLRSAIPPAEEASFGSGTLALVESAKSTLIALDERYTAVYALNSALGAAPRSAVTIQAALQKLLDVRSSQEESAILIEARRVVTALEAAAAIAEASRAARILLTKEETIPVSGLKSQVQKIYDAMSAAQECNKNIVEIEEACREATEVITALDKTAASRAVKSHDRSLELYPRLKTAAQFVSSGNLRTTTEKKEALSRRMKHQVIPLHTSLVAMSNTIVENEAKACHRDILAFSGDIYMSYPEAMAADLIKRGFSSLRIDNEADIRDLRDEIYLQLCKQLTDNPSGTSRYRCWRLLRLVAQTFTPSDTLKPLLETFAEETIIAAGKAATEEVHAVTAKSFLDILQSGRPIYSHPPEAEEIHILCFGSDVHNEKSNGAPMSYQRLRRASINRKAARLNEVATNMDGVDLPDLMPLELKDVLKGETKDDEAVEAAYEQLEIMQHANENKERFLNLVETANTALYTKTGASESHAIDLEAQLSVVQTAKIPGLEVASIIEAEELVARIYDQLDLIDSLLDAIQANSANDLKVALRRAEYMDDARHLTVIKQAEEKLKSLSTSTTSSSFFSRFFK